MKALVSATLALSLLATAAAAQETMGEAIKEKVASATGKVAAAVGLEQNPFTVASPDYGTDQPIADMFVFKGFGCAGGNVSPTLSWSGAPEDTKSYAVTIYDPDAPTGSGWWHWVVYDIPAGVTTLEMGAATTGLPEGAKQGRNDYGQNAYGGPCPPVGDEPHRYIVTVHALDVEMLDVSPDVPTAQIGFNLHAHGLAKAQLTARYGR